MQQPQLSLAPLVVVVTLALCSQPCVSWSLGGQQQQQQKHRADTSNAASSFSRRAFVQACGAAVLAAGSGSLAPNKALAAEEDGGSSTTTITTTNVVVCPKRGANGNYINCVSTASVRQLDNYMPPWTYPKDMSQAVVLARIKGAIASNTKFQVMEQSGDTSLRVQATRSFAKDEIFFLVNPEENVITFISQQIEGPDSPDFGENRKRLEDLRKRIGVFGVAGGEEMYGYGGAGGGPSQGPLGQLKAFYGLQSGKGFEDLILDDE
mmetsp:Transcript_17733/g.22966  ORF Transcript_17733/g.22966 Transcript_17733/m.22966 type:complete len:265 (+) Transcript_17733:183-977(+)